MSERDIRRAVAADRGALLDLIADFYRIDGHEFVGERIETGLAPLLRDDRHGQVWVASTDVALDGYAIVTWSWSLESGGRDCILDELFVTRRGGGTGAALLTHAMAEARRAGAAAMFLETEAPNERARRFYRRHGFTVDDSTWMSSTLV